MEDNTLFPPPGAAPSGTKAKNKSQARTEIAEDQAEDEFNSCVKPTENSGAEIFAHEQPAEPQAEILAELHDAEAAAQSKADEPECEILVWEETNSGEDEKAYRDSDSTNGRRVRVAEENGSNRALNHMLPPSLCPPCKHGQVYVDLKSQKTLPASAAELAGFQSPARAVFQIPGLIRPQRSMLSRSPSTDSAHSNSSAASPASSAETDATNHDDFCHLQPHSKHGPTFQTCNCNGRMSVFNRTTPAHLPLQTLRLSPYHNLVAPYFDHFSHHYEMAIARSIPDEMVSINFLLMYHNYFPGIRSGCIVLTIVLEIRIGVENNISEVEREYVERSAQNLAIQLHDSSNHVDGLLFPTEIMIGDHRLYQ